MYMAIGQAEVLYKEYTPPLLRPHPKVSRSVGHVCHVCREEGPADLMTSPVSWVEGVGHSISKWAEGSSEL